MDTEHRTASSAGQAGPHAGDHRAACGEHQSARAGPECVENQTQNQQTNQSMTNQELDKLLNSVRIEQVIGAHLELKPSGNMFVARCPFHEENTASFVVNPERKLFHCFGCHAGGNAITFVMLHRKVGFNAAVESLKDMVEE